MKAVILAGGKGTRLTPYTEILPKPLMPIGDMPILEVLLRQLKMAGVAEVILTVGHLAHLLKAFFQDGDRLGIKITYSYEEKPLGTAGPLSLVAGKLDSTFLVCNGDILTTLNFQELIKVHCQSGAIALSVVCLVEYWLAGCAVELSVRVRAGLRRAAAIEVMVMGVYRLCDIVCDWPGVAAEM